jgi:probable DNA metabolism protein
MSRVVSLASPVDFEAWRAQARSLLSEGVAPEAVVWRVAGDDDPLPFDPAPPAGPPREIRIPRRFLDIGDLAIRHRDPQRFAYLYLLLWRLAADPRVIDNPADLDVARLSAMVKSVSRDRHKMTAFVRLRECEGEGPRYVSWFEPEHLIEEHVAPFFVDRFASMEFAIFTPRRAILWLGGRLRFGPGGRPDYATGADGFSAAWDAYYRSIFNPGRLMPAAMRKEMPKKYWANLPETRQIRPLLAAASPRVEGWLAAPATPPPRRLPQRPEPAMNLHATPLEDLAAEARACTRCPLYANATQTVFGQGAASARLMFVGEQPGDKEDLAGRPFVGPAGALFDEALAAAGIPRDAVYVTNAVKHFKFEPRGRFRLHKTPETPEIVACRWWLDKELETVTAPLIVAMGATAILSLTGKRQKLKDVRGQVQPFGDGRRLFTTVHPAFVLRIPDAEMARAERARFFADIAAVARLTEEAA